MVDRQTIVHIVTGSRNKSYQITFVIIFLLLLTPFTYLSTTSNNAEDLLEIRSLIISAEEYPEESKQVFLLDFFALSQIDVKFAIPLDNPVFQVVYSNSFENISVNYEFTSISDNGDTKNIISTTYSGPIIEFRMRSVGFTEIYLYSLSVTIIFTDDYFFQGYESYIFLADNFLMLPLFSTIFARETGISYTGMVYSGPNYGGNPSKPLISQELSSSDSGDYSIGLIYFSSLYILVIVIRVFKYVSAKKGFERDDTLYPHS